MEEELISFDTAKLAKEKGFDITSWCSNIASLYDKEGNHVEYTNYGMMGSGLYDGYIKAPTQSFLQKWLREEHGIHININTFYFTDINKFGYEVEDIVCDKGDAEILVGSQNTSYEQVLEKGLQTALKLIDE